jgi:zinc protease
MDRQRDTFTMWSHPASADAASCVALELDLLEAFVDGGLRKKDFTFAKRYLLNSRCFDVDTAQKRLEPRLDTVLFGLPTHYWDDYEKHVGAVTLDDARRAVGEVISPHDLVISITATASDVVPALEKLAGIHSVEVIPYDTD